MVCRSVTVDSKARADNDDVFQIDEETQLMRSLESYWNVNNTNNLKPIFYTLEQVKTHPLGAGPQIVVYYVDENHTPYGVGYTAERIDLDMTIEIRTLHRSHLFLMKNECYRILNYIRKRPFMEWDLIISMGGRRVEPAPGNFYYTIDVKLRRFVNQIADTRWE